MGTLDGERDAGARDRRGDHRRWCGRVYAALNLQSKNATIICKGLVGKSGASIFAGNLVISGRLLGNSEEKARSTAEFLIKYHNQFLIDQNWARRCGDWIERSIIRS